MLTKIKESFLKDFYRKPRYLILFVTSKCNLFCKHCFVKNELFSKSPDLTLQQISNISQQLGRLSEVDLSGGEPFLREDIFEIYKLFVLNNRINIFSIPTNGTLTEQIVSNVRKILEYGRIKHVSIILSIDGPRIIHDKMRGSRCFDKVIETYERIAPLKKSYPCLGIRVNTVLTRHNYDSLQLLHSELIRRMPLLDFHDFEILRGCGHHESLFLGLEELKEIKPTLFKIWRDYSHSRSTVDRRIAFKARVILYEAYMKILETRTQPFPCLAGRFHCVVDYKGDVSFCELRPKIGNLGEESFYNIWNSKDANNQRDDIRKRECFCTHSCFQMTNLTYNQSFWPRLFL
ncbi:MAG: radical SAM protein [Candidatus Omnitrophica bacterium]|nr:radical SAM protein [Candidatus Omnitrophota bacterium]